MAELIVFGSIFLVLIILGIVGYILGERERKKDNKNAP
jgi:hypothetical protein